MRRIGWWIRERLEEALTWLLYKIDSEQKKRDGAP